jgi:senataxin
LDSAERLGTARPDELQRLRQQLWQLKDAAKKNAAFVEGTRASMRQRVLSEAQVVCATLSASGMEMLSKLNFDVVIIDEACQAVEVSALIPLQYGCKHCILVGGTDN